ncbi:MAG: hypothetical protein GC190_21785 [Alphaproteobacteria bacterium]|nr:hypothetical protein [Alphaproteobacteria bacterium]
MSDFAIDAEWSRAKRDAILVPQFYRNYCEDGRYVVVDGGVLSEFLQRRCAVDTIAQLPNGAAAFIEEKIQRWRGRVYTDFALETHSCTRPGREKDGWMKYGLADLLLYAFECADGALDAHLIDFQKLRTWFAPRETSFPTFGPLATSNASMGRLVPIEAVAANVPVRRFHLKAPETAA